MEYKVNMTRVVYALSPLRHDSEEFYLDFESGMTEMEDSCILEYTEEPLELNYADYNVIPIVVEQADEGHVH